MDKFTVCPFTQTHTSYCFLGEHSVFLVTTTRTRTWLSDWTEHVLNTICQASHEAFIISFKPSKVHISTPPPTLQILKVWYNDEKQLTESTCPTPLPRWDCRMELETRAMTRSHSTEFTPQVPWLRTRTWKSGEKNTICWEFTHSSDFTCVTSVNQARIYTFIHSSFNGSMLLKYLTIRQVRWPCNTLLVLQERSWGVETVTWPTPRSYVRHRVWIQTQVCVSKAPVSASRSLLGFETGFLPQPQRQMPLPHFLLLHIPYPTRF